MGLEERMESFQGPVFYFAIHIIIFHHVSGGIWHGSKALVCRSVGDTDNIYNSFEGLI